MKRRGSIALVIALIVVVVLAVAGGIWYWKAHKSSANNSQSQNVVAAPTSTTYQSADYGVSFEYPNNLTVKPGDTAEGDYGLYTPYGPYQNASNTVSLITVEIPPSLYPGTNLKGAYFNLSVDRQLSQSQCLALTAQPGPNNGGGTITIGGVMFNWTRAGSVAMGTDEFSENYSGYTNGTCYEFNLGDTTGSDVSPTGTIELGSANDISLLEGTLSSVKFTNSIVSSTSTTATSNNGSVAACDQSEAQGQNLPDLSGGVTVSQTNQDAILNTLFKAGIINSTSEIESPLAFFSPGQTYLIINNSAKQQMYRATTTDLLNGNVNLVPLASVVGAANWDLWIRGYTDGGLLYTIVGEPSPYVLQAINPQAGQSLWSFSSTTDINNVLVSGDGIFIDYFTHYYYPGFTKLDPATGKVSWQSNVGNLPAILDDGHTVYVVDNSEPATPTLYELSDATGRILVQFPLPRYSNFAGIDECGGNLYLITTGLTPENGNGPDNDYTRFNPQTGALQDVGPVFGSSSSTSTTTDNGGPGIQF
jgi:hypothetical protein